MDLIFIEQEETQKIFDFQQILEFELMHDIQVIRGEDYIYTCYIDKKGYSTALTFTGALVFGIKQYKENEKL